MRALVLRARYAVLAAWALALWASTLTGETGGDWSYFVRADHDLFTGAHLHLYAHHPEYQFGPLAMLASAPFQLFGAHYGRLVAGCACMLAGVVAIALCERAVVHAGMNRDRFKLECGVLVGGLVLLKVWWLPAVTWGHIDDVLALTATAVAVWAVSRDRWLLAATCVGAAAAMKPWAILALPLAMAIPLRRIRGAVVAAAVALAPWVPFIIVDWGTTKVGRIRTNLDPASGLRLLGLQGTTPGWARPLQFVVALLLGYAVCALGRWYLVPFFVYSVRVGLDPTAIEYYMAGPVFGAFVWDVFQPLRVPGIRTALTCVLLLYVPRDLSLIWPATSPTVGAAIRLIPLVFAVGYLVVIGSRHLRHPQQKALTTDGL